MPIPSVGAYGLLSAMKAGACDAVVAPDVQLANVLSVLDLPSNSATPDRFCAYQASGVTEQAGTYAIPYNRNGALGPDAVAAVNSVINVALLFGDYQAQVVGASFTASSRSASCTAAQALMLMGGFDPNIITAMTVKQLSGIFFLCTMCLAFALCVHLAAAKRGPVRSLLRVLQARRPAAGPAAACGRAAASPPSPAPRRR